MKEQSSMVSICLATYNGEKYLKEQLDSILNQTYKNIELLVQDDYSTDNTISILESYKDKINIKIFRNTTNFGYIKNFEAILKKATGEYIAICDQDDIWEQEKIEILIDSIGDNSLVYSNSLLIDERGISLSTTLSEKLKNNFIDSSSCLNYLYDNNVSAHAVLFKNELLHFIFPFPENTYFDAWIAANAASLNGVKYIDANLVHYRQHSTNTLGNVVKSKISINKKIFNKVEKKQFENYLIQKKIIEFQNIKTISNAELDILKQLNIYYSDYEKRWFNISMYKFFSKYSKKLFCITRKKASVLAFKKSIGKKLYQVLPFL